MKPWLWLAAPLRWIGRRVEARIERDIHLALSRAPLPEDKEH